MSHPTLHTLSLYILALSSGLSGFFSGRASVRGWVTNKTRRNPTVFGLCTVEWIKDCTRVYGHALTGNAKHWCPDWDYLPIDETCPEFSVCTCTAYRYIDGKYEIPPLR